VTAVRRVLVAVGVWLAAVTSVGTLVWVTLSTVEQRSSLAVRVDGDLLEPVSATVSTSAAAPSSAVPAPSSAPAPTSAPASPTSASASARTPAPTSARDAARGGAAATGGRAVPSPSRTASGPGRGGRNAAAAPVTPSPDVSVVTYRGRGGLLVLTCSGTAIGNLRGTTAVGWNGRWAVAAPGAAVVWFTRAGDVEELRLTCSDGVGEVAEVRPGEGLMPPRRGGGRSWYRPPHR